MGWTHDYSDAPRNRRSSTGLSTPQRGTSQLAEGDLRVGIPRILRRRARWVSVRLRHPRG
ncbi:hypothetical protein [Streptomyces naphthomycinicus]|uniref:hypothetical protein n=1 Tax=Streptomyces naphthomycinicus TaxID=2872625 RepID=UPI001CEDEE1A|nr:hypothetical protein [Streptomyces sp. TML10]